MKYHFGKFSVEAESFETALFLSLESVGVPMGENLGTCKYCQTPIKKVHTMKDLWVDDTKVFPQYCVSDTPPNQLHVPFQVNSE